MPSAGSTSTAVLSSQVTVLERAHQSRQVRTGCCTFALYRSAWPTRPPNERLTSQNLQELYRGASQRDQHAIAPDECSKALEAVPGFGHDYCLSPTAVNPRSELPATAESCTASELHAGP